MCIYFNNVVTKWVVFASLTNMAAEWMNNNHLEGNTRDPCNTETEPYPFPQKGWDSAEATEDGTCNPLTQRQRYISSGSVSSPLCEVRF